MHKVDYILIGQGLAGSCLALELMRRKKTFIVMDKPQTHSASRVAAGLFNPITGRTNQPTWRAAEIFKLLIEFYREAEIATDAKFLNLVPIYRPFLSRQEQHKWPTESQTWISSLSQTSRFPESINNPFGGIEIQSSGFLDAKIFVESVRKILLSHGKLMEELFIHDQLATGEQVRYKDIAASCIIFCDGTEALSNPLFNWCPIIKLKGELLTVLATLPSEVIINRGVFAVPCHTPNTFTIGSTYHRDPTPGHTETGVKELLAAAGKLFKANLAIAGENWGHRPTTIDRRPLLGAHPKHKNIIIFNGLGTKGVSLAPFFAVHLANWLEGHVELEKEVNIERFYSLYFQSRK